MSEKMLWFLIGTLVASAGWLTVIAAADRELIKALLKFGG